MRLAWQQRLPTLTSHETVALLAALERAQAAVAEIRQRWQRRRAQLKTSHRRARNSLHCTCVRECGSAIEETVNREEAQRLAALEKLPST